MKNLLKSSQERVRIKLRVKAIVFALFPVVSSILRLNGVELLEADWVEFAEWSAYGIALLMEVWGWIRIRFVKKTKK